MKSKHSINKDKAWRIMQRHIQAKTDPGGRTKVPRTLGQPKLASLRTTLSRQSLTETGILPPTPWRGISTGFKLKQHA